MSAALQQSDRRLIAVVDNLTSEAAAVAGRHLTCRSGCTPCCFGPFAITPLDAWRLRQGLDALGTTEPARVTAIRQRARAAVVEQAGAFSPDRVGTFADEAEEARFYTAFAAAPCPALDPNSGACMVYDWRPVVCRTHGPPLRERDGDVAHCPLCFTDATPSEVDAARTTLDVADMEAPLADQVADETGWRGMTTVTFAIADSSTVRRAGAHQTA